MPRSSLLPETSMVFSPALAATIGLEEAILLQQLDALTQHLDGHTQRGFKWFTLPRQQLLNHCGFWTSGDLHRISRNLVEKAVILIDSPPLHSSDQLVFAFNQPAEKSEQVQPTQPPRRAQTLRNNWSPSEDILQLLQLNHAIPRQFALDQLEDFILYWRERDEPSHAWENKFRTHVIGQWRRQQAPKNGSNFEVNQPARLDNNWRPNADALEILNRNGVDPEFVNEAIPEFVLYWKERGSHPKELNSRFIQHIRLQWARYTSAIKHSTEPTRIPADWTPSSDVYDILKLSHIDANFANDLLPEFIVFWRDSNQLQTSWNSKFLQHVKYHWAKQHQLASEATSSTRGRSLSEDLSDTSWAQ
ncbi:MAG: DnaT-like ssDNA-binding domain-containing protein [Aequoribacter sp.]|uniref:DnaT-like ssDNA-binding domain-containing protein n=5 Tax=Aequoribacter sp. TaxID=2847771 RepID=UPI003C366F97